MKAKTDTDLLQTLEGNAIVISLDSLRMLLNSSPSSPVNQNEDDMDCPGSFSEEESAKAEEDLASFTEGEQDGQSDTNPYAPIAFVDVNGKEITACQRGQERLYTQRQTIDLLGVSPITLYRWWQKGTLPRYELEGTDRIYYRESDILCRLKRTIGNSNCNVNSMTENELENT